jgi:beta-lactamase class A
VQPADSTVAVSTPSVNTNGVKTKDHGYLPNVGTVAKSGKMDELKKLISDYTKKLPGKYGVTFIDLATGEMVNVNDKVEYIAASTSKLPINALLYKNIEAGKVKLEDKLVYKKEDLEYGTGSIIGSAFGTQYTVRETSKLSIRKSDNCGVNMLIRLVGIENVRKYMADLGGQVIYGKTHRSCPYDMALIAQDLYKLYLNNEDVYGELFNNLENTDWHDRIDAKLPKEVKVAHKIGNQTTTRNDVGIVFGTHPYVLSVMSDNVNIDAATKSIADLSKKIYNFEEAYAAQTAGAAQ